MARTLFASSGLTTSRRPPRGTSYPRSGAKPDHWQTLAIAISGKPENERINALVDLGRISPDGEPELIRKVEIEIWRKVSQLTFDKAVRELIAEQSKP